MKIRSLRSTAYVLAVVSFLLLAGAMPGMAQQTDPEQSAEIGNWPHSVETADGSAVVYQPQVISWPKRQTLSTRIAMAVSPKTAPANVPAILGTIEVSFTTNTDLSTRRVTLTNPVLESIDFPAAVPAQLQVLQGRIQAALEALPANYIPLDTILLSLNTQAEQPPSVDLHNEPPQIFYSQREASLLIFDGSPVMVPAGDSTLTFAVNTNWSVFFDADSKTWFWLNDGAWLSATDVRGPWAPAGQLPAVFSSLPNDTSFADVLSNVPGKTVTAAQMPQIFVSTVPAEIIVVEGAPKFVDVPSTSLKYIDNSDAAVFKDSSDNNYYFLVSGRWFVSTSLEGPWQFATDKLPADFALIPADGPRGFVLASVPGTTQAQEALIQAEIPQQATLETASTTVDVLYSGEPKFEPIPGTTMTYAVNTSFNVVQVQHNYYTCYQGAWFISPVATGRWVLATSVPAVIYTIPASNPLFPCTYVRVYSTTPTTVTYGYTAGYSMAYINYGVVVYGTGYYYPPVIWPGHIPIYYPYPVSYAGARYYNTATGAWARGGAIYGPWYGARGGSAYNPQTGAWAHGGSVYGPYGGAGAFSAYNPTTGSYAHGSAVYGPNGASANADWYNARTGISGSTNQNSNEYGHWGSSTISGKDQTVNTKTEGDSRGTVGGFSSSTGAEGAGARGADGNSGGAVKTADGDVYAGADGNVYKKTDDGWQKYDDGSWDSVDKPDTSQLTNEGKAASGDNAQQRTADSDQASKVSTDRTADGGESASTTAANRSADAAATTATATATATDRSTTSGGTASAAAANRSATGGETASTTAANRSATGGDAATTATNRRAAGSDTTSTATANQSVNTARTGPFSRGQSSGASSSGSGRLGGTNTTNQLNRDYQARQGGAQRQQGQGSARKGNTGSRRNQG